MLDKFAMGQCTSSELAAKTNKNDCHAESSRENSSANDSNFTSSFKSHSLRRSRRSLAAAWVSNKLQQKCGNKDISATFNLLDHDSKSSLVNINAASEEELMTLSGISRQLAKNIVDYRSTIGGFRRIEDLALVSGIGASLLQCIKSDVTVKKHASHCSSRTDSCDSIPSSDSLKCSSPLLTKVNVNSASIFDLMMARGMSQEMAANIVHYRSKRGKFNHIDELVKVRGISSRILKILRNHLTCNSNELPPTKNCDSQSVTSCRKIGNSTISSRVSCHRRTQSAPLDNDKLSYSIEPAEPRSTPNRSHRFSSEFSADLFELLSLRSERPPCKKAFNGSHNGTEAIRIGSWNVQQLTLDKISNPGVLEVICRTILENGFSILAIQEVTSEEVLNKICSELNEGSLRRIREFNGPRGKWSWIIAPEPSWKSQTRVEFMAFMYNTCHQVSISDSCLLQVHNNNNSKQINGALIRKPFIGYFSVNKLTMVIVNLQVQTKRGTCPKISEEEEPETDQHTDLRENVSNLFFPLIASLKEKLEQEKYVVFLGNFLLPLRDKIFEVLQENSHSPVIPSDSPTDITYDNPKGTACFDNIWLNAHCQTLNTDSCGVIRKGLSHMAIPRGWGWGGMVSDHCPIYCDLLTSPPISSS